MKKLLVLFCLICFSSIFAQTGKIVGRVHLRGTKTPVSGATIQLKGTSIGAVTNEKGRFIIQDVKAGKYEATCSFIGFSKITKKVVVKKNETLTLYFDLERKSIDVQGMTISANRAKERETPIAFVDINEEEIKDKYTTEDMPELLSEVPGLFSSSTGMGESEITMRGFEADKIQVMVNGIPVNDPESQKVYWSNWTGLSSNVKSVQVQKGAGSSLYGSGAFGGSVNIETMDAAPKSTITVRNSIGGYSTEGKVANGEGSVTDYSPYNYNFLVKYNSGLLWDGKFNYNVNIERKAGDSYIEGTGYDGYSFGAETQSKLGDHKVNFSLIAAPQAHNNVYSKSDKNLFKTLGREYNRQNHKYQENEYFKPQISLRDEWQISENKLLMTNIFATTGIGGGSYLSNDNFNVNTGEVIYKDIFFEGDEESDNYNPEEAQLKELWANALYLYETYGIQLDGFEPTQMVGIDGYSYHVPIEGYDQVPMWQSYNASGSDFWRSQYGYSWKNYSVSDHRQFGGNTYFDYQMMPSLKFVFGGEGRYWNADHRRERHNLRVFDPNYDDNIRTIDRTQDQYDYTSTVLNLSGFVRAQYKLAEKYNFMFDVQAARYMSKVEENPIELYDIVTGKKLGYSIYSTKDILEEDEDGNMVKKFSEDDYEKVYKFISPKAGVNLNITDEFNIMLNYSIAHKEPKTNDWYDGYDGPDGKQWYSYAYNDTIFNDAGEIEAINDIYGEEFYGELDPEKIVTQEIGFGYNPFIFGIKTKFSANYYYSEYQDKIDTKYFGIFKANGDPALDNNANPIRESVITNVGEAVHKGLELTSSFKSGSYDLSINGSFSSNRWKNGDYENNYVQKAPNKMLNGSIGYSYDFNNESSIKFGLGCKWWDGYYANNENEYMERYFVEADLSTFGYDEDGNFNETTYQEDIDAAFCYNGVTYYKNEYNNIQQEQDLYELRVRTASSKIPEFLEFNANIKYSFKLAEKDIAIRLDLNNITNRENYSSGIIASDYNRKTENDEGELVNDYLNGNERIEEIPGDLSYRSLLLTPAPLFNFFITTEIKF